MSYGSERPLPVNDDFVLISPVRIFILSKPFASPSLKKSNEISPPGPLSGSIAETLNTNESMSALSGTTAEYDFCEKLG